MGNCLIYYGRFYLIEIYNQKWNFPSNIKLSIHKLNLFKNKTQTKQLF